MIQVLGYKKVLGEGYWYTSGGEKFIRVIMGAAIPIFDRMSGSCVIIGEQYRPGGPAKWDILGVQVGEWPQVTRAMAQYRRDLKFNFIVVDTKAHTEIVYKNIRGLDWGMNEIPWMCYDAPVWAQSEVGRSHVNQMIKEGRLSGLEKGTGVVREMEKEPQMAYLSLQFAMAFAQDMPAIYLQPRKQYGQRRILGTVGLE